MPVWLPTLCSVFMMLQLSLVNLYNVGRVCKRRVKHFTLTLSFAGITAVHTLLMAVLSVFITNIQAFAVIYSFSGLLFLIPLRFLFCDSIIRLISVLFTTKGFTMLALSISVMVSRLFIEKWQSVVILVTLSVLLTVFSPWYSHFCKAVFKLKQSLLPGAVYTRLLQLSSIWFIAITFTYLSATTRNAVFSLLSFLGIGVMAFVCYRLMYTSAKTGQKNTRLTEIVYTDNLTGLANRTLFFQDGQSLIAKGARFEIIFLDLNRFKTINDKYGHLKGNDYLIGFSLALRAVVKDKGKAYRLSGDEFVLLVQNGKAKEISASLGLFTWHKYIKGVEFLGVSAGSAAFPANGNTLDELLHIADKAMYENKRDGLQNAVSWF